MQTIAIDLVRQNRGRMPCVVEYRAVGGCPPVADFVIIMAAGDGSASSECS